MGGDHEAFHLRSITLLRVLMSEFAVPHCRATRRNDPSPCDMTEVPFIKGDAAGDNTSEALASFEGSAVLLL